MGRETGGRLRQRAGAGSGVDTLQAYKREELWRFY